MVPIGNGDKAWELLTRQLDRIEGKVGAVDGKLDDTCEQLAHHKERIDNHARAISWVFRLVGSLGLALVLLVLNIVLGGLK